MSGHEPMNNKKDGSPILAAQTRARSAAQRPDPPGASAIAVRWETAGTRSQWHVFAGKDRTACGEDLPLFADEITIGFDTAVIDCNRCRPRLAVVDRDPTISEVLAAGRWVRCRRPYAVTFGPVTPRDAADPLPVRPEQAASIMFLSDRCRGRNGRFDEIRFLEGLANFLDGDQYTAVLASPMGTRFTLRVKGL